jgi:cysteine-rich repeat protein
MRLRPCTKAAGSFLRVRVAPATLLGAIAVAVVVGTRAPAIADVQGPNFPSTVVNDPSTGMDPWIAPEQAAVSDNIRALISAPGFFQSYYLKATGFGFSIPSGAVIEGIQVNVERLGVFPDFDAAVRIVKGGIVGTTDRSMPGYWSALPPDDEVATYGDGSDLWGETWTAADINGMNFGFALSAAGADNIALVDSISITVFYSTNCGNSQIDVNEDCDDGNTANGDCCSATCHLDTPGTPCPDATVCNGVETCDGAGTCLPGAPLDCDDDNLCTRDSCDAGGGCAHDGSLVTGCRAALKSILLLKDKSPDDKDKLLWKWVKGEPTTQADFGVPTGTTQYALCLHAGTAAALVADYAIPGDGVKWTPISTKGYKYTDPGGSSDGITKVLLKGSPQDKSKCVVKGKGVGLDDFDLTTLVDPVTVQLINDATSACFESTFDEADFITSDDPSEFKAKAR